MTLPRFDPLPAFQFLIGLLNTDDTLSTIKSVAGFVLGGFRECSGLEATLETVDYLEGGVNDRVHRFPGRHSYGNVVLSRGVGLGEDLWLWHQEFIEGKGSRRDGFIILQNDLRVPIKIWTFERGLPVAYRGPTLNAQASEISIESLEIAHEKLKLTMSPGAVLNDLTTSLF